MTKTPGICRNAGCALAKRQRRVQVELKQPFVCPACGGPLAPPPVRNTPEPKLLAFAGLALLVIAALAIWLMRSKPAPAPAPVRTPPPAAHPSPAAVAPAPAPPPSPPPPISEYGSSGPGGPTTVVIPPQLLAPGTKTLAPATPSVAVPPTAPPAPPKRREHHVVATARSPLKAAPSIDMKALDGSQPEYPDAYDDTGVKGEVMVTCIVQPDGSATKCQIIHQTGGAAFGSAVLHWLSRDTTRFPPLLRKGRPAPLPFTWNIEFFP